MEGPRLFSWNWIDFFSRPFKLRVKMISRENGKRWKKKKKCSKLTSFTSMLDAPASREFSISSFTTELTEVMTWELAISRTVDEGKRFIALELKESISAEAVMLMKFLLKTDLIYRLKIFVLIVRHIWSWAGKVFGVTWLFFVMIYERCRTSTNITDNFSDGIKFSQNNW